MRGIMVAIVSGLLSAGCSVFGVRNEQTPPYTVERTIGPADARVEVRRYGPRLAADATVSGTEIGARSKGFQILAGYIFGGNGGKTNIDMTAPVAQERGGSKGQTIDMTAPVAESRATDGQWRIRFFMPVKYTLDTLPRPNDKAIEIVTVPVETIAVYRYTGSTGVAAVQDANARLLSAVNSAGLHGVGEPFAWFYDPPWTLPWLRRNEAAIIIDPG